MAVKVKESVEQMKKQRAIEHMEVALSDLNRYGTAPVVINSVAMVHDALVEEYNESFLEDVPETPVDATSKKKEKGSPPI